MPRSSALCLIALLPGAGCSTPERSAYVNVDQALGASPSLGVQVAERETVGVEEQSFSLPAIGSSALGPSSTGAQEAADFQESQADALRRLRAELFRAYSLEIQRSRAEQVELLERARREDADAASERISALLREQAGRRGQLLARLAFTVGWPNPTVPTAPLATDPPWMARRHQEAREALLKLEQLDHEYQRRASELLDEVWARAGERRTALEIDIVQQLDAAATEAEQNARKAFQAGSEHMEARMGLGTPIESEPVAAQSITVAPHPVPGVRLRFDSNAVTWRERRRAALEKEAEIFLSEIGCRRAQSALKGQDVTEEFLSWKAKRHPGP